MNLNQFIASKIEEYITNLEAELNEVREDLVLAEHNVKCLEEALDKERKEVQRLSTPKDEDKAVVSIRQLADFMVVYAHHITPPSERSQTFWCEGKIPLIKKLRDLLGLGLKESKEAIEAALERKYKNMG